MPIKFPKGFARRKSSGNALEELGPAPEPSFRVFERPHSGSKSFDGSAALKSYIGESGGNNNNNSSEDPYPDNIFAGIERRPMTDNTNTNANTTNNHDDNNSNIGQGKPPARPRMGRLTGSNGSGGTNTSGSSGKLYYDSSSSAKFSSSSTLPSSTDTSAHDVPIPPIPESPFSFSLRASARTFSFGSKAPKAPPHGPPSTPARQTAQPATRERALTASTTSTATPPKLLESDFNIEGSGDLGNIFESYDDAKHHTEAPPSPTLQKPAPAVRPPNPPQKDRPKSKIASTLSPLFGRSKSPLSSNDSQTSRDSLIACPQDDLNVSQQLARKLDQATLSEDAANKDGNRNGRHGYSNSRTGLLQSTSPPIYENGPPAQYLSPNAGFRKATDPEETSLFSSDNDFTTVPLNNHKRQNGPSNLSPPALSIPAERRNEPSMASQATLAARYEEAASNEVPAPKVMTPAQFERYRQQRELTRQPSDASSQSSVAEDSEDDEDEAEKRKKAAMQRKKQEAHLSVYRQQMMKVTGENSKTAASEKSSSSTSERPNSIAGVSPNAANRRSVLDPGTPTETPAAAAPAAGPAEGDEDDEIPLAILAAHGFPNRNRPPSQLMMSNSNPNLRSSYQAPGPGQGAPSVAGDAPTPLNKRSSTLPVFARNLPRDPYYGAGLVNQTHRESLAFGGGTPSVHGGAPSPQPQPQPHVHPGGLVGVIASEERARAMRRGSPNAQAAYDMGGGFGNNQPTVPPSMGHFLGNRDSMAPPDQTQMQVSQQMTQMMQMQIQWMQQMMSFQQYGGQSPPPMPNQNFLQPPGPNQRPNSMLSSGGFPPPRPLMADQRTFSMVEPPAGQWGHNRQSSFIPPLNDMGSFNSPGYAPSVAPSERSNVGAASRYRPVSTIQPSPATFKSNNAHARSSTFTASTLRAWNEEPGSPPGQPQHNHTPTATTIRPVSSIGGNGPLGYTSPSPGPNPTPVPAPAPARTAADDEDDDEGWAEMAKNREKKKKGWRFRKVNSGLDDLYHPPEPENN